jgi:hypothetical protein
VGREDRRQTGGLRSRGIEGIREVIGLLSLTDRQRCALIDKACEIANSHGAHPLKNVRHLIEQKGVKQEHALAATLLPGAVIENRHKRLSARGQDIRKIPAWKTGIVGIIVTDTHPQSTHCRF